MARKILKFITVGLVVTSVYSFVEGQIMNGLVGSLIALSNIFTMIIDNNILKMKVSVETGEKNESNKVD